MSEHLEVLEAVLEHPFKNRELLQRALTHKSRVYEKSIEDPAADNEQFEFLGDAILGFLVSEALVAQHPAFPEGRLSKLKAHLVSASHLHQVALRLQLGHHLLLGRGEEMSGGREKKALLANALEALIAALYLDAGVGPGARVCGSVHRRRSAPAGRGWAAHRSQERAAGNGAGLEAAPSRATRLWRSTDPSTPKLFLVEVRVGRDWVSRAEGLSKKSAGQKAAQQILQQLADWAADI